MARAKRICGMIGCPTPSTQRYCPKHQAEAEAKRGNANQRGYGSQHQTLRKTWAPKVAAGIVHCARCQTLIHPSQAWDLGHNDDDRNRYQGPEHASCNRSEGGRRAHN